MLLGLSVDRISATRDSFSSLRKRGRCPARSLAPPVQGGWPAWPQVVYREKKVSGNLQIVIIQFGDLWLLPSTCTTNPKIQPSGATPCPKPASSEQIPGSRSCWPGLGKGEDQVCGLLGFQRLIWLTVMAWKKIPPWTMGTKHFQGTTGSGGGSFTVEIFGSVPRKQEFKLQWKETYLSYRLKWLLEKKWSQAGSSEGPNYQGSLKTIVGRVFSFFLLVTI